MKFGKEFGIHLEETLPDWRDKFLCYKPLKKLLKSIPQHPPPDLDGVGTARVNSGDAAGTAGGGNVDVEECFVRILDEQLEKFNDFYVDKEEEFVIRLQELKERIERVRAMSNKSECISSEIKFSDEMLEIRKAFVTIHGEMVLLKNYSSLNFAGLVKILKKYDKRTGGLLRLPFTQRALHQPFFTTEPLTRLVRECEANLELLFPLEAEVLESGDQQETSTSGNPKISESSSLDVYRSTLAAMRAIQGLRKASSTYNPLSLGQFFQGVDGEDAAGAVTSENSGSNSPSSSQNEEANQYRAESGNQEHGNSAAASKET